MSIQMSSFFLYSLRIYNKTHHKPFICTNITITSLSTGQHNISQQSQGCSFREICANVVTTGIVGLWLCLGLSERGSVVVTCLKSLVSACKTFLASSKPSCFIMPPLVPANNTTTGAQWEIVNQTLAPDHRETYSLFCRNYMIFFMS